MAVRKRKLTGHKQATFFHKHASQHSEAVSQLGVGTNKGKKIKCNSLRASS